MSSHRFHREKIKQAVERCVPQVEADDTKIMSEEDLACLRQQILEREAAKKLAAELGRTGLRERLKRTLRRIEGLDDDLAEPDHGSNGNGCNGNGLHP